MAPRKLYNFLIDADLAEGLKRVKKRDRESEGSIVRKALRKYLTGEGVMRTERKAVRKR